MFRPGDRVRLIGQNANDAQLNWGEYPSVEGVIVTQEEAFDRLRELGLDDTINDTLRPPAEVLNANQDLAFYQMRLDQNAPYMNHPYVYVWEDEITLIKPAVPTLTEAFR